MSSNHEVKAVAGHLTAECPTAVVMLSAVGYVLAASYAYWAGISLPLSGVMMLLSLLLVWLDRESVDTQQLQTHWRWRLRVCGGNGLWCCGLLPVALVLSAHTDATSNSDVHREVLVAFALCMLITSALVCKVALHGWTPSDCESLTQKSDGEPCLCSPFLTILESPDLKLAVGAIIIVSFVLCKLVVSQYALVCCLLMVQATCQVLLPRWLPRTASMGESAICTQALSVFIFHCLQKQSTSDEVDLMKAASFGQVALLSCIVIVCLLVTIPQCRMHFYTVAAIVAFFVAWPLLYVRLGENFVSWLWRYVTDTPTKLFLFLYWAGCCAIALAIVYIYHCIPLLRTTLARKLFHIIIIAVFVPALVLEATSMLRLAASCALVIFVMAECVRILEVAPFHKHLHDALVPFLCQHDNGPVILTHIYLLTACALPLWLVTPTGRHISLYSGLLCVGIGDAAASICGSLWGRTCWPGSHKTVEGTLSSICLQLLSVWCLLQTGYCLPLSWLRITMAVVLTSLLEAFTTQIDNLVLPLFMYSLLVM